jgi:PA domain
MRSPQLRAFAVTVVLCSSAAFCQVVDVDQPVVNLVDGPVNVSTKFNVSIGIGPAQDPADVAALVTGGLAFYTANYPAFGGFPLPFNIVGADPSLGASTTTIPTVVVPLKFIFPNAGNPVLDGTNVLGATQNSPIFQTADYTAGSVDLGVTQYGDAVQRGEFWNLPGFSPDYHVLLGTPSIAATVTITVPPGKGNAFALSGGGFMGVLDTTYFEQLLTSLLPSYTASQLPIFTTDNAYLGTNGLMQNCCILGFHASQAGPISTAKTWIYAVYAEPGTFSGSEVGLGSVDVVPLSHEVAEWLNDPFVGGFQGVNWIPPAILPGQGGACIPNFETGDPLEAPVVTFTKVTNETTYHLQDEVFLPWYLQGTPSFSVNGWNTFQNLSAQVPLVINSPASIAGSDNNTATLAFAPVNTPVTANVVYVGRGCPGDPYLADPTGQIALIDRGTCAVSLKIDAAATAGATGVLIGLVAPGDPVSFSYGGGSNFVPSLVITQATSNTIKSTLASSQVNATISPNNAIPTPGAKLCGPG